MRVWQPLLCEPDQYLQASGVEIVATVCSEPTIASTLAEMEARTYSEDTQAWLTRFCDTSKQDLAKVKQAGVFKRLVELLTLGTDFARKSAVLALYNAAQFDGPRATVVEAITQHPNAREVLAALMTFKNDALQSQANKLLEYCGDGKGSFGTQLDPDLVHAGSAFMFQKWKELDWKQPTRENADWLIDNGVLICTSLDGPESIHNWNRAWVGKGNAYEKVLYWMKYFNDGFVKQGKDPQLWHVDALMTTTKKTIANYKEVVDLYVDLGIRNIHLRPLNPFGFAQSTWKAIGYSWEEYVEFYTNALDYILELNRQGVQITEGTASTFLQKMLTPDDPKFDAQMAVAEDIMHENRDLLRRLAK